MLLFLFYGIICKVLRQKCDNTTFVLQKYTYADHRAGAVLVALRDEAYGRKTTEVKK